MTVQELIDALSALNPDAKVTAFTMDACDCLVSRDPEIIEYGDGSYGL